METTQQFITRHEGRHKKAYKDSRGIWTVGIGYNLEQPGAKDLITLVGANHAKVCAGTELTDGQIDKLFNYTFAVAVNHAKGAIKDFDSLPQKIQMVVIDMIFQLGLRGFKKFSLLIKALNCRDFETAAAEMIDSEWYHQTPNRAKENVAIVSTYAGK